MANWKLKRKINAINPLKAWADITELTVELHLAMLLKENPKKDKRELWLAELKKIIGHKPYP